MAHTWPKQRGDECGLAASVQEPLSTWQSVCSAAALDCAESAQQETQETFSM